MNDPLLPDDSLERLLRESSKSVGEILDNGFSDGVLAALPERQKTWWPAYLGRLLFFSLAAIIGYLAAPHERASGSWSALANTFAKSFTVFSTPANSELFFGMVVLILIALCYAFWDELYALFEA